MGINAHERHDWEQKTSTYDGSQIEGQGPIQNHETVLPALSESAGFVSHISGNQPEAPQPTLAMSFWTSSARDPARQKRA